MTSITVSRGFVPIKVEIEFSNEREFLAFKKLAQHSVSVSKAITAHYQGEIPKEPWMTIFNNNWTTFENVAYNVLAEISIALSEKSYQ
jgi:hypothetical protein